METRINEDFEEEKGNKTKGKTSKFKTINSSKNYEKFLNIPLDDDLMI